MTATARARWMMLLWLPLASACGSALVGAECAPGYALCDGRCLEADVAAVECADGDGDGAMPQMVEFPVDASVDAASDAGALDSPGLADGGEKTQPDTGSADPDASSADPDTGSADPDASSADPDAGPHPPACALGLKECDGLCVDLQSEPTSCGACGERCGNGQLCQLGLCVDDCAADLLDCGGGCVDPANDPRNCGECGEVCRSGVCAAAECADAMPGHVVVVGHDFSESVNESMQRMVGNAIFLAVGAPVRTVVYRGSAHDASVAGVEAAIARVEVLDGRSWQPREVSADEVTAALASADAFLVHAQALSSNDELLELGTRWANALSDFMQRGGVVVVLETNSEANGGSFRMLEAAGLFSAGRVELLEASTLTVATPGIGVAARTTSSYRGEPNTVRLLGVAEGSVVVEDPEGEPVVVHRVVTP